MDRTKKNAYAAEILNLVHAHGYAGEIILNKKGRDFAVSSFLPGYARNIFPRPQGRDILGRLSDFRSQPERLADLLKEDLARLGREAEEGVYRSKLSDMSENDRAICEEQAAFW